MSKLLKFKHALSVDESCQFLSWLIDEPVSAEMLTEIGKQGYLSQLTSYNELLIGFEVPEEGGIEKLVERLNSNGADHSFTSFEGVRVQAMVLIPLMLSETFSTAVLVEDAKGKEYAVFVKPEDDAGGWTIAGALTMTALKGVNPDDVQRYFYLTSELITLAESANTHGQPPSPELLTEQPGAALFNNAGAWAIKSFDGASGPQIKTPKHLPANENLPLRSRRTLLTIIASLCDDNGIDIKLRGVAQRIRAMTEQIGVPVDDETIRRVLAEIPDALEARSK